MHFEYGCHRQACFRESVSGAGRGDHREAEINQPGCHRDQCLFVPVMG